MNLQLPTTINIHSKVKPVQLKKSTRKDAISARQQEKLAISLTNISKDNYNVGATIIINSEWTKSLSW